MAKDEGNGAVAVALSDAKTEANPALSDRERVRAMVAKVWQRVGRRGAALLFFALLDLVYCYSLAAPQPEVRHSPAFIFVNSLAPMSVWAVLWGAAGIICLINAFRLNDKLGFAAAIAIKVLWGLIYVAATAAGVPRAYVSMTLWLCLAGWVAIISTWPEPPNLKLVRGNPSPPSRLPPTPESFRE